MINTIKIGKDDVLVKELKSEHIINWCREHAQIEWLKATCAKQYPIKSYPRIKVMVDGKVKIKADKTQEPTIKYTDITFIQLKMEFLKQFFPDAIAEKKAKEPTFLDIINSL